MRNRYDQELGTKLQSSPTTQYAVKNARKASCAERAQLLNLQPKNFEPTNTETHKKTLKKAKSKEQLFSPPPLNSAPVTPPSNGYGTSCCMIDSFQCDPAKEKAANRLTRCLCGCDRPERTPWFCSRSQISSQHHNSATARQHQNSLTNTNAQTKRYTSNRKRQNLT